MYNSSVSADNPLPTLAGILDDLDLPLGAEVMKTHVVNIMPQSAKSFILHLARTDQVKAFMAWGLTFRGSPIRCNPSQEYYGINTKEYYGMNTKECQPSNISLVKGRLLGRIIVFRVRAVFLASRVQGSTRVGRFSPNCLDHSRFVIMTRGRGSRSLSK